MILVHGDSETDHCSGVGSAPSYRCRDPPIHQTVRDVANAQQNIRFRRRSGDTGRFDEVPVCRLFPHTPHTPATCKTPSSSATLRSVAPLKIPTPPGTQPKLHELTKLLVNHRYKGMSHSSKPSSASTGSMSPQPTGFSQIHSRGGGEGGGQAMSVLLSWHEKLVEIAGPGSIVRVMSDRRTV